MTEISNREERIISVISSLKELVSIVMAIALTNTMFQFMVKNGNVKLIRDFSLLESLIFVLLIVTIIRFYHGNMRHLDEVFIHPISNNSSSMSVKAHPRIEKMAVDFISILLEGLLFGALSFYFSICRYFFGLFILLLGIDVVWFLIVFASTLPSNQASFQIFKHQRNWLLINVITLIAFLIVYASTENIEQTLRYYIFLTILFSNTFFDYAFNWRFYFPSLFPKERSKKNA